MRLLLFFIWYCCIFNTGLHHLAMGLEESMSHSDNFGTHFVLGFATNPLGSWPENSTLLLTIISQLDANVTISFNETNNTYPVSKGQTKVLSGEIPIAMIMSGDGVEQKGIEITSTDDIVVVCSYKIRQSPPVGYLAVPTRFHGKSYVIASYENSPYFGIISVNMYTLVEIIFSSEVRYNETTYQRGQKLAIILGKLETFSISTKGNREISGTIINANNTIAVISGSQCGQRNPNCLYSMAFMTPVKGWGHGYILMPKRLGYVAKVLIYSNGTNVRIECEDERFSPGTIYHVIKLAYNGDLPCSFVCNKQCQVVQYGHKGESQSEPAMVVVRSARDFRYHYRVEKVGIEKTLPPLTLVVKRHDRNMIRLNDRQIDNNWANIWKDDAWKVINNMRDFVIVRSFIKTKFGLFVKGWTTTNKGTIKSYNSFSHLALGHVTSLNYTKKSYCPMEKVGAPEASGVFTWPETKVGNSATVSCPYNDNVSVTRQCHYTENGKIAWRTFDVKNCKHRDKSQSRLIFRLSQRPLTPDNVLNASEEAKNVSFPGTMLTAGDIVNIANVIENIVAIKEKADEVADNLLRTIDNVLDANLENVMQSSSSSRIVKALSSFLETLNTTAKPFQAVLTNFACDVSTVYPRSFPGLTFSGIINGSDLRKENIQKFPSDKPTIVLRNATTIHIPQTIFNNTAGTNVSVPQTVLLILYKETKFFQTQDTVPSSKGLNSYVIAGSIASLSISDSDTPVTFTYVNLHPGDKNSTLCSFWDFAHGNWSQEGCTFLGVLSDGAIRCSCDHLTNFAILMDIDSHVETSHVKILSVISYAGCAVSLLGLLLTILTVTTLKEFRTKKPYQVLLNFCIALSLALIVFLAAAEKSKTSSMVGCQAAAIALHYFILVTFMWMAIEAFNMYLAFVKVLPTHFSKFMLKCCLAAWGLPAVVVIITVGVALDDYGDNKYCRLYGIPSLVALLIPVVLILLGNTVAFVLIFHSLLNSGSRITSARKVNDLQRARQGMAILTLLGVTWVFGVLAVKDAKLVFQYLFCIFNSLQGLLVFAFYCLLPVTKKLCPKGTETNEMKHFH